MLFQQFSSDAPVPMLYSLPEGPWRKENLPLVREKVAADYLKNTRSIYQVRDGSRDRARTPKILLCSWLPRLSRDMGNNC